MGCPKLAYRTNDTALKVVYRKYAGNENSCTGAYRYGFNGKENDAETGTQDYGLRIYNPALGRFLSVDPLFRAFAWNSTYCFAENSPIKYIDLDGGEKKNNPADCWDGESGSSRGGGIRIFKNIQIPKLKLITHEYTLEKTIISTTTVRLKEPSPGGSLDQTVNIGNTTALVTVNFNMFQEADRLRVDNSQTGNNIADTGPVAGTGAVTIPRGAQNVRIKVDPANPSSTTSVYGVDLQYNDERVFVEKKTKFLGITIKRETSYMSAKESAERIDKRNNDANSNNDIPDGTDIKDTYENQNGPINTGSTKGGG